MKKIRYPKNLKTPGRKFYKTVRSEFEFEDHHDIERLAQAAFCLDEISEAQKIVESEGRFIKNRFGELKDNPGLKVIRDFRTLFIRIVRELGLDLQSTETSRPPRQY